MNKIKFCDEFNKIYQISFLSDTLCIEENYSEDKNKKTKTYINIKEIKKIAVNIRVKTNWKGNRTFFSHMGLRGICRESYDIYIDIRLKTKHKTIILRSYSMGEVSTLYSIIKFMKKVPFLLDIKYKILCSDNIISAAINNYIQNEKILGTFARIKMLYNNTDSKIEKILGCTAYFIIFIIEIFIIIFGICGAALCLHN